MANLAISMNQKLKEEFEEFVEKESINKSDFVSKLIQKELENRKTLKEEKNKKK